MELIPYISWKQTHQDSGIRHSGSFLLHLRHGQGFLSSGHGKVALSHKDGRAAGQLQASERPINAPTEHLSSTVSLCHKQDVTNRLISLLRAQLQLTDDLQAFELAVLSRHQISQTC